jgi:alpha-L-rhamnosidase-like protein
MHAWDNEIDRRSFLVLAGASLGAAALGTAPNSFAEGEKEDPRTASGVEPILHIEADTRHALVTFLSWDTEGGKKAQTNLLRSNSPLTLRVRMGGKWSASGDLQSRRGDTPEGATRYALTLSPNVELRWTIHSSHGQLTMTVTGRGSALRDIEAVEMHFPFDPQITPTTIIPQAWCEEGCAKLPAVISSPDFGQMLLEDQSHPGLKARLEGSREKHTVDLILELPGVGTGDTYKLTLTPVHLPAPKEMIDKTLWREVRRGWFNTWQPSSKWGDQNRPFSAPEGILSNNVISDPVSFALPFYADQALWTPEIARGISILAQVRRSIDWRLDPTGEVVGYWDYRHFLDANPGILIAAWDYVEATGDRGWLKERIARLELLSTFLEQRDVDQDGMVEATQSGNLGTLIQPARSCCWWDALNCGHKDGYTNAFIYRAWRCLAELEGQLGRTQQQANYTQLADRLKAVYFKTLFNPATGWLAWWKSADGQLHDYATPIVNGLAIEYGLVEPDEGRKILARLSKKMQQVNFTRFDLGLPCTLIPVRRGDYLQPDGLGVPTRQDGTDTFQNYMNGGISAGHTLHFIMAHHIVGEPEKGDRILRAMLGRHATIGFQNGVRDKAEEGIDWTTWSGVPKGYEGYLADVFMFMQAAVLREPSVRARFYRPFSPRPTA